MKTAYIIGTGPSLKNVDMSFFKDKDTITFNRAYIAFKDWGFDPTYYLAIDGNDIRSFYQDLNNLIQTSNIKKFFLYKLTDCDLHQDIHFQNNDKQTDESIYQMNDKVVLLQNSDKNLNSLRDIEEEGNILTTSILPNAGFMGLKVLYWMGYKKIVLVGMDARYASEEIRGVEARGGAYIAKHDNDENHFLAEYNGKDCQFGKPNEAEIIQIWKGLMRKKPSDLEIISATENSNLNKFIEYKPLNKII